MARNRFRASITRARTAADEAEAAETLRTASEMPGCPPEAFYFLGRALEEDDETAARGSSALVDGARWAAHVEAAVKKSTTTVSGRKKIHSFAVLKFTKVNYGPWPDELTLVRGENGVLHRASNDELAELERLKAEAKPTSRRSRGNIPAETDEKLVRLDASALDEEGL